MQLRSSCLSLLQNQFTGAGVLLVAFAAPLFPQFIEDAVRLRFEPENCGCSIVKSPVDRQEHSTEGYFDFRRSTSGALIVARFPNLPPPYAFFEISPTSPPRAIPTSKQQWNSAKPTVWGVGTRSVFDRLPTRDIRPIDSVTFRGREYRRAGDHWATRSVAALPSPDQSLLVIQSYSGSHVMDKERKQGGEIFIDIYSADSGARLCRVTGTHQSYHGSGFLDNTAWTADRELVGNLAPAFTFELLYCNFNSSSPRK